MCIDPFTLAAGVSAVGSAVSGIQGYQSSRAQAKFQERQAQIEQEKGAYEAARTRDANKRAIARQRAGYLSSGIALDGSALAVIEDSTLEGSLDEQAIRYGATINRDNSRFSAGMSRMNATSQLVGGAIGAVTPFINASTQRSQNNQQRTMIRNPYAMAGA